MKKKHNSYAFKILIKNKNKKGDTFYHKHISCNKMGGKVSSLERISNSYIRSTISKGDFFRRLNFSWYVLFLNFYVKGKKRKKRKKEKETVFIKELISKPN